MKISSHTHMQQLKVFDARQDICQFILIKNSVDHDKRRYCQLFLIKGYTPGDSDKFYFHCIGCYS